MDAQSNSAIIPSASRLCLAGPFAGKLHFNLSHSGNWAAYAFARDRKVGIDIEPFCYDKPWHDMVSSIFSKNELAEFVELPKPEKLRAFLRGWTRKEAYVKGRGEGFSYPLNVFNVPLAELGRRTPAAVRDHANRNARWNVCSLDLMPGYASALVMEELRPRLCFFNGPTV